ncbi:MAG TPA: hypothetical protein ENI39_04685 [Anaerolineae bacterium]|nr:hypothetical protein [Anaerolineae bacterium]
MGHYDDRDDWPVAPPPGWRPPQVREQAGWIVGMIVGVTGAVDVLVAVWLLHRPWGTPAGGWVRQLLLCSAVPLNLTALVAGVLWLIRKRRQRRGI